MKKITAYEVDGEVFTNKKEAEKAEVKYKESLARERLESEKAGLLAKVDEINKKLGCNTFLNKYGSKFKRGDKVRALESCVCADHQGQVGVIDGIDSVSAYCGIMYKVKFGPVPRLPEGNTDCLIPEKDLEAEDPLSRQNCIDASREILLRSVRERHGKKAADNVVTRWVEENSKVDGGYLCPHCGAHSSGKMFRDDVRVCPSCEENWGQNNKPKFKNGDRVRVVKDLPHGTDVGPPTKAGSYVIITGVKHYSHEEDRYTTSLTGHYLYDASYFELGWDKPKFKKGDRVRVKDGM